MAKKIRAFTAVIHNVKPNSKQQLIDKFQPSCKKILAGEERYNHQDGQHLHLFFSFKNQRYFKPVLLELKEKARAIIDYDAEPDDNEAQWGRVQLDQMKGNFEQARRYLEGDTKVKFVDGNLFEVGHTQEEYDKMADEWIETICRICMNPDSVEAKMQREWSARYAETFKKKIFPYRNVNNSEKTQDDPLHKIWI